MLRGEAGFAPFVGVGLKPEHVATILEDGPEIGFFEIHAENYMGLGGPPHSHLAAIRGRYGVSIHGVGLSLGGMLPLDEDHLDRLSILVGRYDPMLVSEHLAWCSTERGFLNDLLPVRYNRASLNRVVENVDRAQAALGRHILLENPSTYLAFEESDFSEAEFIAEVARRSGCALLLDVNNAYVSSVNHGSDAKTYLASFPTGLVEEIHLAGHSPRTDEHGVRFLVDSHDRPVAEPVWDLYKIAIALTGPVPTLIERDANIPTWYELHAEAKRAQTCIEDVCGVDRAVAR